jgi:hypothetical protein
VLDAALHPADNGKVLASERAPRRPARDRPPVRRAISRKHGKLTSRSSPFCFLNGDAGVCSDITVTCAPDEEHQRGNALLRLHLA